MDFSFSDLNFNSVENMPGFETCEALVDALFNQNYTWEQTIMYSFDNSRIIRNFAV